MKSLFQKVLEPDAQDSGDVGEVTDAALCGPTGPCSEATNKAPPRCHRLPFLPLRLTLA